jgi:hypothetical protein
MALQYRASFWRVGVRMLGLLSVVGCAGAAGITGPSSTQNDAERTVRVTGTIAFSNCGSSAGCTFEGQVLNDAGSCVSNVRGVVHLLDAAGSDIEARSWTINGRVRPGQTVAFSGCCFSASAVNGRASERTEVLFNTIACI